ncbi:MAG: hypothetical protein EBR60_07855 [Burkholderiaceae bacterium]|nr:hypothetical protein [Burkholderiaceae bacterium]
MALSILDGNQSATTLSTILSSGQHITAHTVVSLGTQAITDIVNATSTGLTNTQLRASAVTVGGTVTVGNSVTISSLPAISGTVTANLGFNAGWKLLYSRSWNSSQASFQVDTTGYSELAFQQGSSGGVSSYLTVISFTDGEDYNWGIGGSNQLGFGNNTFITKNQRIGIMQVDMNNWDSGESQSTAIYGRTSVSEINVSNSVTIGSLPAISGTVTVGSALPAGTNRIGVVTIGAGTVTIGAGTAQIGSVTASISGTVPVSGTFFQATQPASLASLPALAAGTNQIGSVTASISGTVPISISSVTVGNSVTIASLPALAAGTAQIGSVTASISANPSGALTTRFGSVTTANTAQITTAVTNTSRKYLFAQNISIGSVTMGIGFSPTTTQGIQLSAGSGIVFDSFCPTGAVYWLGATTGAAWSILEG